MKNIGFIFYFSGSLFSATGYLNGLIRDASTHQPLVGVNVIISGTELGAATNVDGNFKIDDIPVGSCNVLVSMIGYEAISRANVHIVPQRTTTANFDLHPKVLESNEVNVTAKFFERAKDAVTSSRTVDIEEIRSDPIGAYDIMAMMQSLPSVVSGSDQYNEIIVRGGAPGENLFVMDHLEIPYPNHYPEQGKGGGPITMVDTEFIERIDFYAGAFPSRYGGKLSSVMDVTLRSGARDKHLGEATMNMAGFGANMEGPFGEKGSYLFSLKRSFLDFVMRSTGLQAVPQYWSSQGKITTDISPTKKLMINFLGGIDAIHIKGERNPSLRGAENVEFDSQQATIGVTYKNLFSRNGYSILSLSQSLVHLNADVYELVEEQKRNIFYRQNDLENESTVRGELNYKIAPGLGIGSGFSIKMSSLDYDNFFEIRPTILYGYSHSTNEIPALVTIDDFYEKYFQEQATIVTPLDTLGTLDTVRTNSLLDYRKMGGFIHVSFSPAHSMELSLGGRYDHLDHTGVGNISPRFGMSYHFNDLLSLNFSSGRYFQSPANMYLNSDRGNPKNLKNYFADQSAIGLEYFPTVDTRITLESFIKEYADMITYEILDGSDGRDSLNHQNVINGGKGRSQGLELFIQKKYSMKWYGSLAWSHSIAEGVDPRTDEYYPWTYDYGDVINIIGGYKIRYADYEWYQIFKQTIWAKTLSWLPFMPSDEFEISFRFRYMGGRPYTKKNYDHNIREWYVDSSQPWNTERYEPYIRLDLMLQQRFYFERVNMITFWDFLNIFNIDNPWEYIYKKDGTKEMAWQYKTMPIGGVIIEF